MYVSVVMVERRKKMSFFEKEINLTKIKRMKKVASLAISYWILQIWKKIEEGRKERNERRGFLKGIGVNIVSWLTVQKVCSEREGALLFWWKRDQYFPCSIFQIYLLKLFIRFQNFCIVTMWCKMRLWCISLNWTQSIQP